MLYTIMPLETIFEGIYKNDGYEREQKIYNGQMVEVTKTENNTFKLIRVISTNPNMYLDENFSPGKIIK